MGKSRGPGTRATRGRRELGSGRLSSGRPRRGRVPRRSAMSGAVSGPFLLPPWTPSGETLPPHPPARSRRCAPSVSPTLSPCKGATRGGPSCDRLAPQHRVLGLTALEQEAGRPPASGPSPVACRPPCRPPQPDSGRAGAWPRGPPAALRTAQPRRVAGGDPRDPRRWQSPPDKGRPSPRGPQSGPCGRGLCKAVLGAASPLASLHGPPPLEGPSRGSGRCRSARSQRRPR